MILAANEVYKHLKNCNQCLTKKKYYLEKLMGVYNRALGKVPRQSDRFQILTEITDG